LLHERRGHGVDRKRECEGELFLEARVDVAKMDFEQPALRRSAMNSSTTSATVLRAMLDG
jgi:hypothetical protein